MTIGKPAATTALALGVVAITAGSAGAQEVTAEGAAAIHQGLKEWMVEYLSFPEDTVSLTFDGSITVEPAGDRYELTVPPPRLTTYRGENLIETSAFTATLVPEGEHRYRVTWQVPTAWQVGPPGAGDRVSITLTQEAGEGLFDARYASFLDMDAVFSGIEIAPASEEGRAGIDAVRISAASAELGDEIYDIDAAAVIEGISFVDHGGGGEGSIAEISAAFVMEQLDMPGYYAFSQTVNDLVADFEALAETGGDPGPLMEEAAVLAESIFDLLDGAEMVYEVSDVSFTEGGEAADIEGGSFSFGVGGMRGDTGNVTLALQSGSVAIDPPPPFADAIPQGVDIDLALVDLPRDALAAAFGSAIRGAFDSGPEAALMAALFPLQQAATAAGSRFNVNRLELTNPSYDVALDGYVATSTAAPFGAVGEAELVVGQFAALRALVERLSPDPDAAAGLAFFEAAGQQVDGADARRYTFEATEDGRFLLNGGDMGPLLDQMMQ